MCKIILKNWWKFEKIRKIENKIKQRWLMHWSIVNNNTHSHTHISIDYWLTNVIEIVWCFIKINCIWVHEPVVIKFVSLFTRTRKEEKKMWSKFNLTHLSLCVFMILLIIMINFIYQLISMRNPVSFFRNYYYYPFIIIIIVIFNICD